MMSDNKLDELLKNIIQDHPSLVPENMWERIMEKKKRDRKIFFFFRGSLGISLLLLLTGLGAYLIIEKNFPDNKTLTTIAQIPDSEPVKFSKREDQYVKNQNKIKPNKPVSSVHAPSVNAGSAIESSNRLQEQVSLQYGESAGIGSTKVSKKSDSSLSTTKALDKKSRADSTQKIESAPVKEKKNQMPGKWYLDLYASPDIPIAVQPSSPFNLSYTIGLKLNRSFGKHFSGKIGIQFSRINMDWIVIHFQIT